MEEEKLLEGGCGPARNKEQPFKNQGLDLATSTSGSDLGVC